jgi:murein DD-endopeptidase MepM/ murein hydrolase activator NlpD
MGQGRGAAPAAYPPGRHHRDPARRRNGPVADPAHRRDAQPGRQQRRAGLLGKLPRPPGGESAPRALPARSPPHSMRPGWLPGCPTAPSCGSPASTPGTSILRSTSAATTGSPWSTRRSGRTAKTARRRDRGRRVQQPGPQLSSRPLRRRRRPPRYYTPEGESMRKAFLRAPVDFTRVSSNFNPNRLHPILKKRRPHQGVDYAARSGTPIMAAGDGRVLSAGPKGGYGNTVVLQHGGNVTTLYAHMSRIGADARVGRRVRQGDIIGYVGMTGLAAAPHLHYEYRVNGVHKNPRTVELPKAEPVPAARRAEFAAVTTPLIAELDGLGPCGWPPPTDGSALAKPPKSRPVAISVSSPGPRWTPSVRCWRRSPTTGFQVAREPARGAASAARGAPAAPRHSGCPRGVAGRPDRRAGRAGLPGRRTVRRRRPRPAGGARAGAGGQSAPSAATARRCGTGPARRDRSRCRSVIPTSSQCAPASRWWPTSAAATWRSAARARRSCRPFHAAVFADPGERRAVLNLGGVANLTLLEPGRPVTGFDTGPANGLMDAWTRRHLEPALRRGRRLGRRPARSCRPAAAGAARAPLPRAAPPKSTGPEDFSPAWLDDMVAQRRQAAARGSAGDLVRIHGGHGGGRAGRSAAAAPDRLRRRYPQPSPAGAWRPACPHTRRSKAARLHGIDPDQVEAAAFAWLAARTLAGLPGNVPSVTGAVRPAVLGAIWPGASRTARTARRDERTGRRGAPPPGAVPEPRTRRAGVPPAHPGAGQRPRGTAARAPAVPVPVLHQPGQVLRDPGRRPEGPHRARHLLPAPRQPEPGRYPGGDRTRGRRARLGAVPGIQRVARPDARRPRRALRAPRRLESRARRAGRDASFARKCCRC